MTYTLTYITYRSHLHVYTYVHVYAPTENDAFTYPRFIERSLSFLVRYTFYYYFPLLSLFLPSPFVAHLWYHLSLCLFLYLLLFLSSPALHVSLMILSSYFMYLTSRAPLHLFAHCRYIGRRVGVRLYQRIKRLANRDITKKTFSCEDREY